MPMDMCWKTDVKKCIKKLGKSHHWKIPLIPQKTGKGLKALTFPPHTTGPTQTHLIAACDPPFDVMWGTLKELEWCSFQQKRSTASMAHGMENHARYTSFLYQKMIWSCWFPGNSKAISSHVLTSRPKQEIWSENQSFESSSAVFRSPSMRFELWQAIQTVEFRIIGWSKTPASRSHVDHVTKQDGRFWKLQKTTKSCHQKSRIGGRILGR